ncbi:hypothetical protein [Cupriavidus sp. D39]|uniref:hypothetical protein n=1 Tax=Cupriavidus sp. D39 TaxID=2997877 RepID=UPI0022713CD3|nr:hypothetical protein [Cupriavidus sp. D39]MCY0854847.1 hypothetical protein [Cupriavidus sp. D39]
MQEEFGYKDAAGRWVAGFGSRRDAISAAAQVGMTQVVTAGFSPEPPSYFARFEATRILERMLAGMALGEQEGKLIGSDQAQDVLAPILAATIGDGFPDRESPEPWKLQRDLMNRLQTAVAAWMEENHLEFAPPKVVVYGSEQLHIGGTNLDVPLLWSFWG